MPGGGVEVSTSDGVDFVSPSTGDYTPTDTGVLAKVGAQLVNGSRTDLKGRTRIYSDIGAIAADASLAAATENTNSVDDIDAGNIDQELFDFPVLIPSSQLDAGFWGSVRDSHYLSFDGVNDKVDLASPLSLQAGDVVTLYFNRWVPGGNQYVFDTGESTRLYLYFSSSNTINYGGTGGAVFVSTAELDGKSITNGEPVPQDNSVHELALTVFAAGNIDILGAFNTGAAAFYNGGIHRLTVERSGSLVHDYLVTPTTSGSLIDSVGGNNGTISGASTQPAGGDDVRVFVNNNTVECPVEVVSLDPQSPYISMNGTETDYLSFASTISHQDSAWEIEIEHRCREGVDSGTLERHFLLCGPSTSTFSEIREDSGDLRFVWRPNNANKTFDWSGTDATDYYANNAWRTLRLVWDGVNLRAYMDGVEATSGAVTGETDASIHFDNFTQFGRIGTQLTFNFGGDVRRIRYWSDNTRTSLVHDWQVASDSFSSGVIVDAGSAQNDATINGSVPGGQTAEIWAKIPYVSNITNTPIQIHTDGVSSAPPVDSTYGRNSVWANDYAFVSHDGLTDSTGNSTLTNNGATTGVSGQIGEAIEFDGSGGDNVNGGSDASIDDIFSDPATVQLWVRTDSTGEGGLGRLIQKRSPGWGLRVSSNNTLSFLHDFSTNDGEWTFPVTFGATFRKVDVHYDRSPNTNDPTAYVDGLPVTVTEISTAVGNALSDSGQDLGIGNNLGLNREFDGALDEIRLRTADLSAAWIKAEHLNQSDPGTFFASGGGGLTLDSLVQEQTIGVITLTQQHILTVDGVDQEQTLGPVTFSTGASVTPADTEQDQQIDEPTLTQAHVTAPADVDQDQSVDEPTLTQAGSVSPAEVDQEQFVDAPTLTQASSIVPADADQTQEIDAPTLTQAHIIVPAELAQDQVVGSPTIVATGTLLLDDVNQLQTVAVAVLTQAGIIAPDEISQEQVADGVILTQAHIISPDDVTQTVDLESVTLQAFVDALNVADIIQDQTLDGTNLTQFHVFAVDEITQTQAIQAANFGGLVIGSLEGKILIYAAMAGDVTLH